VKHAIVVYDISHINLVSFIIKFNKKFYILTQCSGTFVGFNWQVREFILINCNNFHVPAVTDWQTRQDVFRDIKYPELFNNMGIIPAR